ncbi:MAG: lipid IV(A) palmitoyltransferase PagP [Burkholderiaceae bacterium]|nr:lipid IV(A) palmitoyltransferase PagP [Burkholderiaceae bacterium]MCD8565495.1 lipid IV(A) palmitoyltransferase PagP [Burkholderiaceae bacterium]
MKTFRIAPSVLTAAALLLTTPAMANTQDNEPGWFDTAWQNVNEIWDTGDTELYVPFLTYHMRWAYRDDLIQKYNEFPAGLGLGKARYNDKGNWESIYAMGFADSHNKPSFMVGYAWAPTWDLGNDFKAGVGLTGFLMTRTNEFNGFPFPGILPIASISYKQLAIQASYVPGGQNNGNVLFMWGKWTFK